MRKRRADVVIPFLTLILMAIGLVVIYTIGPVRAKFLQVAYGGEFDSNYFIVHQLISVGLAIAAFVFFYKFEFEKLRKFTKAILAISILACAVLAVAQVVHLPIARCELGACRWFNFAGISLQPAEFLKFGMALYLAQIAAEYKKAGGFSGKKVNWAAFTQGIKAETVPGMVLEFIKRVFKNPIGKFWLRFGVSTVMSLFFVVIVQKDMGSGIPILVETLAILLAAGVSFKTFMVILIIAGMAGGLAVVTSEHRMERVMTYFGMSASAEDDEADENAYHIENALIAIGSGGLWGVGIGNSVQATGYLPESINDSVFAIMGETFGLMGLVVVLGLFMWLLLRIIKVADHSPDQEMSLVAVGAFAWLMTHVVVNIMAMTGLAPLTGITLPLLSYGGTSMMCVAGMLGLVMQLSQWTLRDAIKDKERIAKKTEGDSRTSRVNRAQYVPGAQFRRRG